MKNLMSLIRNSKLNKSSVIDYPKEPTPSKKQPIKRNNKSHPKSKPKSNNIKHVIEQEIAQQTVIDEMIDNATLFDDIVKSEEE
jgi:hypothetical protein